MRIAAESIRISLADEILFDQTIIYNSCPVPVATVNIMLMDTIQLIGLVDEQRTSKGYLPMLPNDDGKFDQNGWYRFYINLNDYLSHHVDNAIEATVESESAPDDFDCYSIDLTDEEQQMVYDALDKQLRKIEGKSAEELLAEARDYMKEG